MFRSVLENSNDAVPVTEGTPIDEPGPRIVYANPAFSRTTGYSYDEIVGRSPRILQGPSGVTVPKRDFCALRLAA